MNEQNIQNPEEMKQEGTIEAGSGEQQQPQKKHFFVRVAETIDKVKHHPVGKVVYTAGKWSVRCLAAWKLYDLLGGGKKEQTEPQPAIEAPAEEHQEQEPSLVEPAVEETNEAVVNE